MRSCWFPKTANHVPRARLIDVWFDSGPCRMRNSITRLKTRKSLNTTSADFIAEGVDQTRGWFYTLHAIATMVFDDVAFKNVVSNGLVLDANGDKMSKSKGNVVDPFQTIEKYGADCTRWYLISNAPPWDNLRFDPKGIEEVRRKFSAPFTNILLLRPVRQPRQIRIPRGGDPAQKAPRKRPLDHIGIELADRKRDADFADYEPTSAARRVENSSTRTSALVCAPQPAAILERRVQRRQDRGLSDLYTCLVSIAKLMRR